MKRSFFILIIFAFSACLNAISQDQDVWIEQKWENDKWNNVFRHIYEYENDMLTLLIYQNWENENWIGKTRFIHQYDSQGREISYLIQFQDDISWYDYMLEENIFEDEKLVKSVLYYGGENHEELEIDSETIYIYNKGLLEKTETYRFQHEERILYSEILYEYDSKDRITEKLNKDFDFSTGGPVNSYREQRIYEVDIDPPVQIIYQKWTDNWTNVQKEIFSYGDDELWDEHIVQVGEDEWINQNKVIKTRDEDNREIEMITQYWDADEGWLNSNRSTSEYNDDGKMTRNIEEIYDGDEWINDLEHLYLYQDNRRFLTLNSLWVEDEWIYDTRNFLEGWLSVEENLAGGIEYNILPNPASSEINISFYLDKPAIVRIKVLGCDGSAYMDLSPGFESGGEKSYYADIINLASGSYIIQLLINGRSYMKRLLIVK